MFDRIADAAARGELNAVQMGAAIQLMGGNGERVMTALLRGFSQFRQEAIDSGQVVAEDVMGPAGDSIAELKTGLEGLALSFRSLLIPAAEEFADAILPVINFADDATAVLESRLPSILARVKQIAIGVALTGTGSSGLSGAGLDASASLEPEARAAASGNNQRLAEVFLKRQAQLNAQRSNRGGASDADIQKQLGVAARIQQLAGTIGGSARDPVGDLSSAGIFATPGETAAHTQAQRSLHLLQRISINTARTADQVKKQ